MNMDDKQKQIAEMAKDLEQAKYLAMGTVGSLNNGFGGWYGAYMYNQGYRKQSEVVKEFIKTLKERFEKTSTMATALHGRKESEIESIINIVAAEYVVEAR